MPVPHWQWVIRVKVMWPGPVHMHRQRLTGSSESQLHCPGTLAHADGCLRVTLLGY